MGEERKSQGGKRDERTNRKRSKRWGSKAKGSQGISGERDMAKQMGGIKVEKGRRVEEGACVEIWEWKKNEEIGKGKREKREGEERERNA